MLLLDMFVERTRRRMVLAALETSVEVFALHVAVE